MILNRERLFFILAWRTPVDFHQNENIFNPQNFSYTKYFVHQFHFLITGDWHLLVVDQIIV